MSLILGTIFILAVMAACTNRKIFEDIIGLAFLWRILKSLRNPVHFTRKRFPKGLPSYVSLNNNENLLLMENSRAQVFKMEKKEEYSQSFKGRTFLTTQRLIFVHDEGVIVIPLKKIVSMLSLKRGVKVFHEGKNPIYFSGKNSQLYNEYYNFVNDIKPYDVNEFMY